MFLAPRSRELGARTPMNKSPEALADRAHELWPKNLGAYRRPSTARSGSAPSADTPTTWPTIPPTREGWQRRLAVQAWPSPVSFWYRQSPDWMAP